MSEHEHAAFSTPHAPRWLMGVVLVMSLILAGSAYQQFLANARGRWNGAAFDRAGHYIAPQKLAVSIRTLDVPSALNEIFKARRYPPLHFWLDAVVLTIAGPHYVLGVLPSLLGWILTAVCGFAIALRSVDGRRGGVAAVVAGVIYLAFFFASPAFRIYATDIMLESLGAGLTMLCLLAWVRCCQTPAGEKAAGAWRLLGVGLTLLFLHKYNYWLLAVIAIGVDALIMHRAGLVAQAAKVRGGIGPVLRWVAHHPLTIGGLGVFGVAVGMLLAGGPEAITVGRTTITVYPPKFICTVGFWMVAGDAGIWWWRKRREGGAKGARGVELTAAQRGVLLWHVLPVGIWCLLPARLYDVIYFLSPANKIPGHHSSIVTGAPFYLKAALADYHWAPWSFGVAAGLFVIGLALMQRARPGIRAVFVLVLIGTALTISHPTHCSRFLHTWIPALWLGAGIGAALLVTVVRLPWWLGAAGAAALVVISAPAFIARGHGEEFGQRHETTSLLDVTDAYLPKLAKYKQVTIFSACGWATCEWTYIEKYHNIRGVNVVHWPIEIAHEDAQARTAAILKNTKSDAIVVINAEPGTLWNSEGYHDDESHRQVNDQLAKQSVFRPVFTQTVPSMGATIVIWERQAEGAGRAAESAPAATQAARP